MTFTTLVHRRTFILCDGRWYYSFIYFCTYVPIVSVLLSYLLINVLTKMYIYYTPTYIYIYKLICLRCVGNNHYNDIIMRAMAYQITGVSIVYSTLGSGLDKKKSKLRVTGLCAGNSPVIGKFPTQKASNAENIFPFDDVIMIWSMDCANNECFTHKYEWKWLSNHLTKIRYSR